MKGLLIYIQSVIPRVFALCKNYRGIHKDGSPYSRLHGLGNDESIGRCTNALLFMLMAAVGILIAPEVFAAPPANPFTGAVDCAVVSLNIAGFGINVGAGFDPICSAFWYIESLFGTTGKAIATVAIMIVGFAALLGKVSWPQAFVVVLGVAIIFGASDLITNMGVSSTAGPTFTGAKNPIPALTTPDPVSAVLYTLTGMMESTSGRMIAIAAAIILGLGALFGKITWIHALMWVVGIGMIFGSASIVDAFWTNSIIPNAIPEGFLTLTTVTDPVAQTFNTIVLFLMSFTGIAIATFAVIALGVMAILGKVSWVRAMLLIAGIALLFGATNVVFILGQPLSATMCNLMGAGFAQAGITSDDFTIVLCSFLAELQGPLGITIATLAIMILGILAMLGRVSWELALTVCVGIGLIFGANAVVNLLTFFNNNLVGGGCGTSAIASLLNTLFGDVLGNVGSIVGVSLPGSTDALSAVLCQILAIIYGPAGKALASIAIVMMGFGALLGKVSYAQAFIVVGGIALTFGAPQIVGFLLPNASVSVCLQNISSVFGAKAASLIGC